MKLFTRAVLILGASLALWPDLHASPGTDAFENLKALEGTWDITNDGAAMGQGTYEVVADGSVVLERVLGMTTTYFLDDDLLMAVHYCSAHNQPRFKATVQTTATNVMFEVVDVGGMHNPNDGHMAKLSLVFEDADLFTQSWTWRENGVDLTPETFIYRRVTVPISVPGINL